MPDPAKGCLFQWHQCFSKVLSKLVLVCSGHGKGLCSSPPGCDSCSTIPVEWGLLCSLPRGLSRQWQWGASSLPCPSHFPSRILPKRANGIVSLGSEHTHDYSAKLTAAKSRRQTLCPCADEWKKPGICTPQSNALLQRRIYLSNL